MTFKQNLAELKRLKSSAPDPNKNRIQDLIDLYEAKRIPNYRSAYNAAVSLASRNRITMKSDKPLRLYHDIIDKYKIDVRTGNHEKVKTDIKFEFPDPAENSRSEPFNRCSNSLAIVLSRSWRRSS